MPSLYLDGQRQMGRNSCGPELAERWTIRNLGAYDHRANREINLRANHRFRRLYCACVPFDPLVCVMPRFLGSAVLNLCCLFCSIAIAQTSATYTTAKGPPNSDSYGTTVTVTAEAPRSTPAANGADFNTTPFSTYFGAPIDSSFTNILGQATGDLNGDGVPDLLIYQAVNTGTSPSPVRVQSFLSNGKGGFTSGMAQQLTLPVTTTANVAVTPPPAIDVNGDGKLDLLIGTA